MEPQNNLNEFPTNQQHLAIAMAYKNRQYIADMALPIVQVASRKFDWWEYDLSDGFAIPDMKVGKFDQAPEIRFKSTQKVDGVVNHALSEPVSLEDQDDSPDGVDPIAKATERITELLLLGREKRTADLLFNAAAYAAANKVTLSGDDQFSDPDSDPIKQLTDIMDGMVIRPTKMVLGRKVWSAIARHAKVVKASNKNAGDSGIVDRRVVADILELEEIIVGESFLNTAAKGQTVSMSRVWGNFLLLAYYNKTADNNGGLTFGYTARYKNKIVKSLGQPDRGLHGVQKQTVGESTKEIISAPSCGFLITNPIA